MQLIVDIKNESISDKIIQLLKIFQNDGVEIKKTEYPQRKNKELRSQRVYRDENIEKNWEQIIRSAHVPENYYKSEQYAEDRVEDLKERGKI